MNSQTSKKVVEKDFYKSFVPPGHYYSPVPSIEEILKNKKKIWGDPEKTLPGIDLRIEEQLSLLEKFNEFYAVMPFTDEKKGNLRYFFLNSAYSYSDAIFLYCMIRHTRPKNIIEIGSGYSTCVSLDTNELFFNNSISIECIEPNPQLLYSLIREEDLSRLKVNACGLQDIPLNFFRKLKPGDILFIDSTHVSKIGSDVNYIIHKILPSLASGVYIHFHDVFYPFEYPQYWLLEGRFWNEQYILRAFLEYNSQFKIVLFNTYLEHFYRKKLEKKFPLIYKNPGGSLWIKKI